VSKRGIFQKREEKLPNPKLLNGRVLCFISDVNFNKQGRLAKHF